MISEPWEGVTVQMSYSVVLFLPKTALLQRRHCLHKFSGCHRKTVSEEERETQRLLYDFYTLPGFRLTCGLVTGMEVDHVLVEFVHVCVFS